jgi:hypothetical protein
VVAVTTKTVFGDTNAMNAQLRTSPASTTINPSFVERENVMLRRRNRRLRRKTSGLSKELSWLEKQLWLALADDHLVLLHDSLRQRLATPEPTRGHGSARHRVPAAFTDRMQHMEHLFPSLEPVHQGN